MDASTEIGAGHLMRCIALAQALRRRGAAVTFATRTVPHGLRPLLASASDEVVSLADASPEADAGRTGAIADARGSEWVVVDGYDFGVEFRRALRRAGHSVMYIDDLAEGFFACDLVLNQNLHADENAYRRADHTRLLLGPLYALLREEFVTVEPVDRSVRRGDDARVLVTLGGGDPGNQTGVVLEALLTASVPGLRIRVICGAAFPHLAEVRALVTGADVPVHVLSDVRDMVEQMTWADRCVTAGGSTCWELCRLGVPMAVGVLAPNQAPVAESIARNGLGISLGWLTTTTVPDLAARLRAWFAHEPEAERMATRAATVVDGRGAERVAEILTSADRTSTPIQSNSR